MNEEIQNYLSSDGNWKRFIKGELNVDRLNLVDVEVISARQENSNVYFEVSITFSNSISQKTVYESGRVTVDDAGSIISFRQFVL